MKGPALDRAILAGDIRDVVADWLELKGWGGAADDLRLLLPTPLVLQAVDRRRVRMPRRPASWLQRTVNRLRDLADTKRGRALEEMAHRDREAAAGVPRETLPPTVPPAVPMA